MKKVVGVLIVLGVFVHPAAAQTTKVLRGSEITESALIEALSPEGGIRTRSFKVLRDEPGAAEQAAKASMLITFHTNSADLTPEARQSLDVVGRALNMNKLASYDFIIEGHADPRGGPDFNQWLSQARAQTVRDYLVQNHHIDENRLSAVGKGDRELLDKENLVAPENRRVTIVTKQK
ncbi:MAG TPA: OmpA family protein [Nitrosospira sp.]|nr:OmpA family protein [Nitrosospira sp.]